MIALALWPETIADLAVAMDAFEELGASMPCLGIEQALGMGLPEHARSKHSIYLIRVVPPSHNYRHRYSTTSATVRGYGLQWRRSHSGRAHGSTLRW